MLVQSADLALDRLLMNAFNTVNMAAACIVTTAENARRLNIPEERWVYPLAAAGTSDPEDCELH